MKSLGLEVKSLALFLTKKAWSWPRSWSWKNWSLGVGLDKKSFYVTGWSTEGILLRLLTTWEYCCRWPREYCHTGAMSILRRWSVTTLPSFCRFSILPSSRCPRLIGISRLSSCRRACCDTCTMSTELCMMTFPPNIVRTLSSMSTVITRGVRLAKNDFGLVLQKTVVFGSVSVLLN